MPISALSQMFPPKSKVQESDLPDLTGLVACVTGGNTGLGKETARVLLAHGARVYIACRNSEKAEATMAELKEITGKDDIHFLQLDLADIKATKAAAEELIRKETKLHLLFNNAGVSDWQTGLKTKDDYELHWGTNVLGPFIFTETLFPLLSSTASDSTTPPSTVRIITVSSFVHEDAGPGGVNLDDQFLGGKGPARNLYYQSKFGNVVCALYWAERGREKGVASFSVNPGAVHTEIGRTWPWVARVAIMAMIAHPAQQAAITQLYAGTSPEVTFAQSGAYFVPWARMDTLSRKEFKDEQRMKEIVEHIQRQVEKALE